MLPENHDLLCIKLNFYVTDDDISTLLSCGLSGNTMREIPVERPLQYIHGKSESAAKAILLTRYSSHFL